MMKILFICGSMELGKDGVGDYTRRLAGELIRQGHQAVVMAINDRHIKTTVQEFQQDKQESISVLRLPAQMSWKHRVDIAKVFLEEFQADWLSLQYVPYSFHEKGLAWQLPSFLMQLDFKGKWHVMLHELWIGINPQSSFKHKIIGRIQAYITLRLINYLRPRLITTSNVLYMEVLKSKGIKATHLPLFSNIPYMPSRPEEVNQRYHIPSNAIVIGIFGTLYPDARLNDMFNQIVLEEQHQPFILLSFGRIGNKTIWSALQEKWQDKVHFLLLGELDQKEVSAIMQRVNIALSCTPLEYLGKSGVYAAWKRHGVPVMVKSVNPFPAYQNLLEKTYNEMEQLVPQSWDVKMVTQFFEKTLSKKI